MTAVPGSIRNSAYASLMLGNQIVCGWTWQTMHAGEEQYLQGMIDWDGEPTRKLDEYRQIAAEFRKIENFGFPYTAVGRNRDRDGLPQPNRERRLSRGHDDQVHTASDRSPRPQSRRPHRRCQPDAT